MILSLTVKRKENVKQVIYTPKSSTFSNCRQTGTCTRLDLESLFGGSTWRAQQLVYA